MFYKQFLGMPDRNKGTSVLRPCFCRCIVALDVYYIVLLLSGIGARS